MLKVENVLNTSFDALIENFFDKTPPKNKTGNSSQILNNLGDYIEIYKEKKSLEVKKEHLDKMLVVKNAVIDDLHEQITEETLKGKKLLKERESAIAESKNQTLELAKTSHEIRTPISGILGTTSLLMETDPTPEQEKLIGVIESSSRSLLTLINDILDYSKIKAGELRIERQPFNIEQVVQEVIQILEFQARENQTVVLSHFSDDVPALVEGDPQRLKQVLLNLVGNAVKFTEKGEVGIRTSLSKKSNQQAIIKLEIEDTGIGIPPDKISHLFKNFSQISASVTQRYGGTGLGLAISKELIEKMGGQIGVTSQIHQGTTFWVKVPFNYSKCRSNDPRKSGKQQISKKTNCHPIKDATVIRKNIQILLVDDDDVNRKVNSLLLKKWGYQVDTAGNGEEAITKLEENQYDIVLMDVQMPTMDGIEATRAIRNHQNGLINPNLPIIAISANALDRDREKCLEAGMDDYIVKPFNLEVINTKIDDQLSKATLSDLPCLSHKRHFHQNSFGMADLKQLRSDTREDFSSLVEVFLTHLPIRIEKIGIAFQEGDYRQLKAVSHQLKGSASIFYAEKMVDICSRLESLDRSDIQECAKSLISRLKIEEKLVTDSLQSIINETDNSLDL